MSGLRGPVLVTGGSGFIGRRVIRRCLEQGVEARNLSLPGEAVPPEWPGPVARFEGDVAARIDMARAAKGAGTIIHLAAPVGVGGRYDWQWRIIAEGTRHAAEAAAVNGARLVVASSVAVYGDLIQTRVCTEEVGHGAWQGAYGRAKQGQETVALEVAARLGVPLTLVRPGNVYGVGGASAWGDRFIAAIAETGGLVVGDAERNNAGLVHVENLADALILAASHPAAIGRTYNVCDGLDVTWRRFTNDLAKIAGRPPPPAFPLADLLALAEGNEDPAHLVAPRDLALPLMEGLNLIGFDNRFDASRIRTELGWIPRLGYDAAFREIATAYGREWP